MALATSPAATLAALPTAEREIFLMGLTPKQMNALRWDWRFWARPQQVEPPGDWSVWLAMAGRGFGKTRLGAEWIREQVCGRTPMAAGLHENIAIVAETAADARDVMIQGPSGILACHPPDFRPVYKKSQRVLEWPNGAKALTFSAEEPDQLRGPNFSCAWCLVGDTPVLMADGTQKRIDQINAGEVVLTRAGAREVLKAGLTGLAQRVFRVILSDGRQVTATANHKFWIADHGWVPLEKLSAGDRVCAIDVSNGVGKLGTCGVNSPTARVVQVAKVQRNTCTGKLQKSSLARYLKVWTFIISMGISTTTIQKISFFFLEANTGATTRKVILNLRKLVKSCRQLCVDVQQSFLLWKISATSAVMYLPSRLALEKHKSPVCSVVEGVPTLFGDQRLSLNKGSVVHAGANTRPNDLFKNTAANDATLGARSGLTGQGAIRVVRVESVQRPENVYDLTVAGEHEFYANGVLVHNSDELAKWDYASETWDMLQFTLRLGDNPRQLVTTTPRPIPIVRELLRAEGKPHGTHVTRGSTYDNAANLSPKFIAKMQERYEGTRLGRQELQAEILDDLPNALWTRAMLERRHPGNPLAAGLAPDERVPDMARVVVGVDPSGTSGEDDSADSVGIVVAGRGMDGLFYVLEDATCDLGPAGWSKVVAQQYDLHAADLVVGERNFGGAMVEFTVRTASRDINYKDVKASRGKAIRAEPVAALFERGKVRLVKSFPALEDQLLSFTRTGYFGDASPDRADALVWALTELAFDETDYDPAMYGRLVD